MADSRSQSRDSCNADFTVPGINMGSFQRIADACELMAQNYKTLLADRDRYRSWYREAKAAEQRIARSNAAFRGVATRRRDQLNSYIRQVRALRYSLKTRARDRSVILPTYERNFLTKMERRLRDIQV